MDREQEYLKKVQEELSDTVDWVHDNLNSHQALVITLDGLKIVSDDLSIPYMYVSLK
jgi:hypothetical protein